MSKRQRRNQRMIVPPTFTVSESENFRYVFASGVFGGLAPNDCRILFYLDRLVPSMVKGQPGKMTTDSINREFQVEVHLTPFEFKQVANWMNTHVAQYEEKIGKIVSPEKETSEGGNPLVS